MEWSEDVDCVEHVEWPQDMQWSDDVEWLEGMEVRRNIIFGNRQQGVMVVLVNI